MDVAASYLPQPATSRPSGVSGGMGAATAGECVRAEFHQDQASS